VSAVRAIHVPVSYNARSGCAVAIGTPILGLVAYAVIEMLLAGKDVTSSGPGIFGLAAFGGVWFLIPLVNFAEKRKHVRVFDAEGLTTYGGARYPWSGFQGVFENRRRMRSGMLVTINYRLAFSTGAAQLEPKMMKDWVSAASVLSALQQRDFAALQACFSA
jgi:hypothetical protein